MRKTSPRISKRSPRRLQKLKRSNAADHSLAKIIAANFSRHRSRKEGVATGFWQKTFPEEKSGIISSLNLSSKPKKKAARKNLDTFSLRELDACSKDVFKAWNASSSCKKSQPKQVKQKSKITRKLSKKVDANDFDEKYAAQIKKRVMYLLNRMNKEQNLIDAYSAEGWKGQSREKLRPERELQKAKSRILRFQLRIRDAMHELELLGLEGTMKAYIFDSHGQIYHEDIFCATCKRQDITVNNDIILCDGACDRAFHQLCLRPPLRTDEIPPDDEGWLCPVCDCKWECLDAVNAYTGMSYSVQDPWEKIFSEADLFRNDDGSLYPEVENWPSEDSGDADYVPIAENNRPERGFYNQQASSDESVSLVSDRWAPNSDASESMAPRLHLFNKLAEHMESKCGTHCEEENISRDEDNVVLTDGKRQRKDIDYIQLHDEMFGKAALLEEASEDEEWGPKGQGNAKKLLRQIDSSAGILEKAVLTASSSARSNKQRRLFLPPDVVEKLRAAFKENPLPSRTCKEELSKQLDLSFGKVHVWFKNRRQAALKKGLIQRARKRYTNLLGPAMGTEGQRKVPSALVGKDPSHHYWLLLMNMISSAQLKLEILSLRLQHKQVEEQDSDSFMYVAVPELKERIQT